MPSKRKLHKDQNENKVTNKKKSSIVESNKPILSPLSYDRDLTGKIRSAFREKVDFDTDDVSYSVKPFPHWCIKNFVQDMELLEKLKTDLLKLKFKNKYTDLFKFSQSEDIRKHKVNSIATFRQSLFTDFRTWLENTLETKLSDSIDMSCAKYNYTDFLLCHDDKVEDRQVAFIYYLVPEDWTHGDGGRLDLFNNKDGHPSDLCKSLIPTHNSLVFFEVSDTSFHQVSEVLSESKTRLSISGWFHSITDPQFQHLKYVEEQKRSTPLDVEQEMLLEWIEARYLLPDITDDIQKEFEENSEIQLNDFLKKEMYEKLVDELCSMKQNTWKEKGPVNKRKLLSLQEGELDPNGMVCKFLQLVRSVPFFKLLRVFTDLDLAVLEGEDEGERGFSSEPSCVVETRKWKHGCFTILEDSQFEGEACLDCIFNVGCEDWEESERGYISYVAGEETEELVTVFPTSNCLSLVYRDENTTRFVKYFDNEYCGDKKYFFDFDMIYYEGKKENEKEE